MADLFYVTLARLVLGQLVILVIYNHIYTAPLRFYYVCLGQKVDIWNIRVVVSSNTNSLTNNDLTTLDLGPFLTRTYILRQRFVEARLER